MFVAFRCVCNNARNYALDIESDKSTVGITPASEMMPNFNGSQDIAPTPVENVVKDSRNCGRTACHLGGIQANDELADLESLRDRTGR